MILYYVRHGDPIYDPDSLTKLGERQAEAIGRRIAAHGIDKIFASTSNRAYQTAVPLSEITNKEITKVEFLNENYAGKYFARPWEEGDPARWIYHQPAFRAFAAREEVLRLGDRWYEHPRLERYNFGEGVEFFAKNIDEFLLDLGYKHNRETHSYSAVKRNDERIAIFAHEGMGCAFLSSLLDIPYSLFASHFAMQTTGLTVIYFEEEGEVIVPRLLTYSNDAHIYGSDLPTIYSSIGRPI